jgi:hypothetical protein
MKCFIMHLMGDADRLAIYILDTDPTKCAQYYCNKHITFKILEITDLLYATYAISNDSGIDDVQHSGPDFIKEYLKDAPCHKSWITKGGAKEHPSFLWAKESIQNYRWLAELGYALCLEYSYRWERKHKYEDYIIWLKNNEPSLPDIGLTKFLLVMPPRFKSEDPVESYRQFYMVDKQKPNWGKRRKPDWFIISDLVGLIKSSAIDDSFSEFFPILLMNEKKIRKYSFGVVENSEMVDMKFLLQELFDKRNKISTQEKPKRISSNALLFKDDGLFCAKIFGPLKDYTCLCGKYENDSSKKNEVCRKCGVEIIKAEARRERFAHIELATPIVHSWFKEIISILLDISMDDLESIIRYRRYLVIRSDVASLREGKLLTEMERRDKWLRFGDKCSIFGGAEAIRELLRKVDLNKRHHELKRKCESSSNPDDLINLKLFSIFRSSGNKAEQMVLDAIPILPPDLRPLHFVTKGSFVGPFADTPINHAYRRIIIANNRLKRLFELSAHSSIIKSDKSRLQSIIDNLFCDYKNRTSLSSLLVLNFMHLQKKIHSPDFEIKAFDPSVFFAKFNVKEYPNNLPNYDDCLKELSINDLTYKILCLLQALCIDVKSIVSLNTLEEFVKNVHQIISLFIPHIKKKYDYEYV